MRFCVGATVALVSVLAAGCGEAEQRDGTGSGQPSVTVVQPTVDELIRDCKLNGA
jgi:hypothetical protein